MKCVVSLLEMTFKPTTVAYRLAVNSRLRLFSLQAVADLLQCHSKLQCANLKTVMWFSIALILRFREVYTKKLNILATYRSCIVLRSDKLFPPLLYLLNTWGCSRFFITDKCLLSAIWPVGRPTRFTLVVYVKYLQSVSKVCQNQFIESNTHTHPHKLVAVCVYLTAFEG